MLHLLANLPQRPRSTVPRSRRIPGLDAFAQSPWRTFLINHNLENKHHHLTKTIDVLFIWCQFVYVQVSCSRTHQLIQSLRLFDADLQPDRLSYFFWPMWNNKWGNMCLGFWSVGFHSCTKGPARSPWQWQEHPCWSTSEALPASAHDLPRCDQHGSFQAASNSNAVWKQTLFIIM